VFKSWPPRQADRGGHKAAEVTLDTYVDPFDDELDAVAVTLHARYSARGNCDSPKLLASSLKRLSVIR
jgi:hypothetical protein